MTSVAVILSGNANVHALADSSPSSGRLSEIHFAGYTPLSSNMELARRTLSPLRAAELPTFLAQKGERLSEQPVDLAQESFALYVPAREPPQGYGLVVFVMPWDAARLPDGWAPVLDERGLIFVSAARSGNDQSAVGRREPLAVLSEQNVVQRYRIDPQRIYVAGFSGGSRVALRLALAYPDLFRGAVLNASSDPIGTAAVQLPPKDLFRQFQERSHFVYVTGDRDTARVAWDFASMHSLRDWCVFNVEYQTSNFTDHEIMSPEALSRALDWLAKPITADAVRLARCRAGIDAELESKLRQVQSLISAGNRDAARDILKEIDTRFGGLAAPQTLELESELDKPAAKP
ncbi:MAG: PHB depolymerase family esterase [Rhizomicrobium sp.]